MWASSGGFSHLLQFMKNFALKNWHFILPVVTTCTSQNHFLYFLWCRGDDPRYPEDSNSTTTIDQPGSSPARTCGIGPARSHRPAGPLVFWPASPWPAPPPWSATQGGLQAGSPRAIMASWPDASWPASHQAAKGRLSLWPRACCPCGQYGRLPLSHGGWLYKINITIPSDTSWRQCGWLARLLPQTAIPQQYPRYSLALLTNSATHYMTSRDKMEQPTGPLVLSPSLSHPPGHRAYKVTQGAFTRHSLRLWDTHTDQSFLAGETSRAEQ
jgi:hypothetical protein